MAAAGVVRLAAPRGAEVDADHDLLDFGLCCEVVDGLLFQVRQDLERPAESLLLRTVRLAVGLVLPAGPAAALTCGFQDRPGAVAPGGQRVQGAQVIVARQPHLLELVDALGPPRRLARGLHRRQQQADEDPDDGNDDEQFHQRETPWGPGRSPRRTPDTVDRQSL